MPVPFDWNEVLRLDKVPSTMDVAWQRLEAGNDAVVVRAEQQSRGRGRRGRVWVAPHGSSLMLSLGFRLRDPGWLPAMNRAVALGALAALRQHVPPEHVGLKWPNDLLVTSPDDRPATARSATRRSGPDAAGRDTAQTAGKIGGLLAESRLGSQEATLVVGLAINVTQAGADLPPGGVSLRTLDVYLRPDDLEGPVLEQIRTQVRRARSGDSLLDPWRDVLWTLGQRVTVHQGSADGRDHVWVGVAEDVDLNGGLLVRVGDTLRTVYAGDVTIRRA